MARSLAAVVAVAFGLAFLSPAHAVVPPLRQPTWAELTPEQKQILQPLSGEWDKLESYRQKKWLGIAQRYPALNPEEQARVQRRMKDWVRLSPEERKVAREKYKNLQKAPPEHKEAIKQKWQEYKQLPEEEKQRLKEEAARAKAQPKPGKARNISNQKKPTPSPFTAPPVAAPVANPPVPASPVTTAPSATPAVPASSTAPAQQ